MKRRSIVWLVVISLALLRNASGQGFINLDFEGATIVPDPSSSYYPYAVYASYAIPGWTPSGYLGPSDVLYNGISLGAPNVSLVNATNPYPSALDGQYGVFLQGSASGSASISQSAVVPTSTESLLFRAQAGPGAASGSLLVSLGGQPISYSTIALGPDYTLYGGNIPSNLAGQYEQLVFSALTGGGNNWNIDDIQFSPSSVPEPSVLPLLAWGGLLFGLRRSK